MERTDSGGWLQCQSATTATQGRVDPHSEERREQPWRFGRTVRSHSVQQWIPGLPYGPRKKDNCIQFQLRGPA